MKEPSIQPGSRYLSSPARTLHDACREAGRDNGGKACPGCPVRDLCEAEAGRADRRERA